MTLASEGACWHYLGRIYWYFQSKATQDAIRGSLKSMVKHAATEVSNDWRHIQYGAGKSALKGVRYRCLGRNNYGPPRFALMCAAQMFS
jgi:hypothetical protein